jgi:hypothetical protein
MINLVTPTVHLNGTTGQHLLDQQLDVIHALENVLTVMSQACPNARDFYPQGEGVALEARGAYNERRKVITNMIAEYETIAINIHEQINRRVA